MHVVFIAYGMKQRVDELFMDMMAQKHQIKCYDKDDKHIKTEWIQSQIRYLPFGVYEYVFPKEDLDIVLNTLGDIHGSLGKKQQWIFKILRQFLKCKPIPKYNKDKKYLWLKENVSINVIGIREDKMQWFPSDNCMHEAI